MIVFKPSFFPGWTMHFNFLATLSKIPLCVECCSPPPILPDKIQTYFSLKNFFKKILFREQWKEKERERNINVWLLLVCPHRGLVHNPTMCPRLGIKLSTIWFAGQHSIHWATPARAQTYFSVKTFIIPQVELIYYSINKYFNKNNDS